MRICDKKKELDTITNIQSDLINRQPRQQLKKVTSAVKPLFGITLKKIQAELRHYIGNQICAPTMMFSNLNYYTTGFELLV